MLVNFVEAWNVVLQAWENIMDCEHESKFTDEHLLHRVC